MPNLRAIKLVIIAAAFALSALALNAQGVPPMPPNLADFWDGRAEWQLDIADVGLPVGESDTIALDENRYWSYLHASHQSAAVFDQCGQPVAFPGCLTVWESRDGGRHFDLPRPVCLLPCKACPCDDRRDHITAQQYPRVARAADGTWHLAYEWHAQVMLRQSPNGIDWSDWHYLLTPGGTWPSSYAPCSETERIGPHPNIRGEVHDCLVGAPPGIYIEGDTLYVFVAAGSAPGHIRCYKGSRFASLSRLQRCQTDPLLTGALEYGDLSLRGAAANPYFDFRYLSSAEVLRVGAHYYLFYEGIRGPEELEIGSDTQFGLGLARSVGPEIDGAWEKYAGSPLLMDTAFNWGVGHADLLLIEGRTYLYTATSTETRGRYVLVWR